MSDVILNGYYNAVRKHLEQMLNVGNKNNIIIYQIMDDEKNDPSLISLRVYGTRKYVNEIMSCLNINGIWEEIPRNKVGFPLLQSIVALRSTWGITD